MKKNKKLFLSIAAAATLLVTAPGMNKTEAADHVQVQAKVHAYQINHLNQDQIHTILKKYTNQTSKLTQEQINDIITKFFKQNLGNLQYKGQTQATSKKEVQKPTKPVTQKPDKTAVQQPAKKEVQQPTKPVQQEKPTAQQPTKTEQPAKPVTQQPIKTEQPAKTSTSTSLAVSAFEQQVVELTNKEREKAGLQPLQLDTALSKVAREKSRDMQAKNYFSHTSPTYGSPFDMMKQFGISYKTAGENIAMGQRSPEEVVNAWMNSEGHRKNILSSNFTHIGVGHIENGNYWTQMFIGK